MREITSLDTPGSIVLGRYANVGCERKSHEKKERQKERQKEKDKESEESVSLSLVSPPLALSSSFLFVSFLSIPFIFLLHYSQREREARSALTIRMPPSQVLPFPS